MSFFSGLSSVADSIGGVLGSSGSSVGGALLQSVVNNYYNKKAASKQYDYTKSLIDYENEYNDPSEMRARLEAAGYNPNLALNGVNVTSATGSAPNVKPGQLDLLSAYNLEAQYDLLKEQQKLTKATAVKNVADAGKTAEQTETEKLKNAKLRKDLKFYEDTGIDPDSWQGNAVKPIWNVADKVVDFAIRHEPADTDFIWKIRNERARKEYYKRMSGKK